MLVAIDGRVPGVSFTAIGREASILDGENAGRLKNGTMSRDIIGTYYNFELEAYPETNNLSGYDDFYELITAPVESRTVTMPFGQGVLDFKGYVAEASDDLMFRGRGGDIWSKLVFTVIAERPQRYFGESWSIGSGSGNGLFKIDNINFDVSVTGLTRTGSVLDSDQSGRSKSGVMQREIIGTFYNYNLSIEASTHNVKEYDSLYYALTAPVNSHSITIPYGQGTLNFDAYVSKVSDKLISTAGQVNTWGGMTVDFVAMQPKRKGGAR